jgi:hypothetical protein
LLGNHDDFDLAPQNVENGVGGVSLRENDLFASVLKFGSAATRLSEGRLGSNEGPLTFLAMIQFPGGIVMSGRRPLIKGYFGVALVVGAVMSSAFGAEN